MKKLLVLLVVLMFYSTSAFAWGGWGGGGGSLPDGGNDNDLLIRSGLTGAWTLNIPELTITKAHTTAITSTFAYFAAMEAVEITTTKATITEATLKAITVTDNTKQYSFFGLADSSVYPEASITGPGLTVKGNDLIYQNGEVYTVTRTYQAYIPKAITTTAIDVEPYNATFVANYYGAQVTTTLSANCDSPGWHNTWIVDGAYMQHITCTGADRIYVSKTIGSAATAYAGIWAKIGTVFELYRTAADKFVLIVIQGTAGTDVGGY